MNYYFLLEDSKSFIKILPKWLEYLGFGCTRVPDINHVETNNYILQSGQGVIQLVTKVLFDTIDTIQQYPNKIDKLVVVLDAESETVSSRKQQVIDKIAEKYIIDTLDFDIEIFVCNCCIETWLLGRKGMYPQPSEVIPSAEKYQYFCTHFEHHYYHYNIETENPELMLLPTGSSETKAHYHFSYFHDLCLYNYLTKKESLRYLKSKPLLAMERTFFDGLMERINDTTHLTSLKEFIDFLKNNE